jgi:hypothetical protein
MDDFFAKTLKRFSVASAELYIRTGFLGWVNGSSSTRRHFFFMPAINLQNGGGRQLTMSLSWAAAFCDGIYFAIRSEIVDE